MTELQAEIATGVAIGFAAGFLWMIGSIALGWTAATIILHFTKR